MARRTSVRYGSSCQCPAGAGAARYCGHGKDRADALPVTEWERLPSRVSAPGACYYLNAGAAQVAVLTFAPNVVQSPAPVSLSDRPRLWLPARAGRRPRTPTETGPQHRSSESWPGPGPVSPSEARAAQPVAKT